MGNQDLEIEARQETAETPEEQKAVESPVVEASKQAPTPSPSVAPRPHIITILLGLMSPILALVALGISLKSFQLSQKSIDFAVSSQKIAQRAYIHSRVTIDRSKDTVRDGNNSIRRPWRVKITADNLGSTPAITSRMHAEVRSLEEELPIAGDSLSLFDLGHASIGAKEAIELECCRVWAKEPRAPSSAVVQIDIDYDDVFRDSHHTQTYCVIHIPAEVQGWSSVNEKFDAFVNDCRTEAY